MESENFLSDLADFEPDPPKMRDICDRCMRPAVVCWCPHLPREPVEIDTNVVILQHPYEVSRRLKTAPMLFHGITPGKCQIIQSKKFPVHKYPEIQALIDDPRTILMYPSTDSVDLATFMETEQAAGRGRGTHYNLILLDGTWFQARGIFCQHKYLQNLKQVKLSGTGLSEYIIRTQPNDASLSTLETAVIALSVIENKPHIKDPLLEPLRAMCKFQMKHGAVTHHSKQYLIENGLYKKQVSKIQRRKFIEVAGTKLNIKDKDDEIRNCEDESDTLAANSKHVINCDNIDNGEDPCDMLSDSLNL